MSRRESYRAPLQRSKFMIDFWIGVYQLKQIFVQRSKSIEKGVLIPEFFSPTCGDSNSRNIDDVDIYDADRSLSIVVELRDSILPEIYSQLQSAGQLRNSLCASVKANLMTTRVTGYVKKSTLSSLLNRSDSGAHLTTDNKLIPDVMSLEYRVCHAVLYMCQLDFEDVMGNVEAKIQRTMKHIKDILCATLREVDPTLTIEFIEQAGLFQWSNPPFLTSWGAFVTSLQPKKGSTPREDASTPTKDAAKKKKSMFKKVRNSVVSGLSPSKQSHKPAADTPSSLLSQVMSLAPIHEVYLNTMEVLNSPSSSLCFNNLRESNKFVASAERSRQGSAVSDTSSNTDSESPKWYFGKLVGRRPPSGQSTTAMEKSTADGGGDGDEWGDLAAEYYQACGRVFVSEEDNAAVEIDHRLIHFVVNEAPAVGGNHGDGDKHCMVDGRVGHDNHTNVRLFSWYMYVIMHNSRCAKEKVKVAKATHDSLAASVSRDTDRQCMLDFIKVCRELVDSSACTSQIARSLRGLFTGEGEEEEEADSSSYKLTILSNLCSYVTLYWLKETQQVLAAVTQFVAMRRENICAMMKKAMPFCSEEELEDVVTHDDGMHVHKLITAVNNGHTELARLLETRLKGPHSVEYTSLVLFRDQAGHLVSTLGALLDTPLKHFKY